MATQPENAIEQALRDKIATLPCWSGPVEPRLLTGGRTNVNFHVKDIGGEYVVRSGEDAPLHGILRFNELAIARAAEDAGISPALVHHEPGILVMRYLEGRALEETDIRREPTLEHVTEIVRRCHRELGNRVRGPVLAFCPFRVIHDYAATLRRGGSRMTPRLGEFIGYADRLQRAVGPGEHVLCHNDLIAANFIDSGGRLWLIDWDYGGFGNPLFDLGGLSSNNGFSVQQDRRLLEIYFERDVPDVLYYRFTAMKAASALREAMWSMVSEIHSDLDVDYEGYTAENLSRFDCAWDDFRQMDA